MNLEEKRSIEEDYQMILSISQKKGQDKDGLRFCIYGDGAEILGGTIALLEEISKNLGISLDDLCRMIQSLGEIKRKLER